MAQKKREIIPYEKIGGQCPIQEFLDSLSANDSVYVEKALERLETYGHELRRPHVDNLGNKKKIWELRVKTKTNEYRLLFFYDEQRIVFTNGFPKRSGPVRDSEIDKAVEYRNDYFKRKG